MKVFKFGGASVRNADAIRNAAQIIRSYQHEGLVVVVSAMGKTTNALERVLSAFRIDKTHQVEVSNLVKFHQQIAADLFPTAHPIHKEIESWGGSLEEQLFKHADEDCQYDQVVSLGEIISSRIVAEYLIQEDLNCQWLDARQFVKTDSNFREARVDWDATTAKLGTLLPVKGTLLTQGFIGSNGSLATTLGREGSDFSAAIFASCLGAESVTIWKDVPGVMTADPKRLPDAKTFDELPFREAAEMTYYGASVIHPKTIKPLANKRIPLLVKNFDNPALEGTRIHECKIDKIPPLIVFKDNQCLISCHVMDYTFINEPQLETIFNALSTHGLKVNLMQNSAISFSFCLDFSERKVMRLIEYLSNQFEVYYNTGLTLITIKNYDEALFETYRKLPNIMLEQSSRSTLQVLIKS